MRFIGREKELQSIRNQLNQHGPSALLLYGRRRVGKTTLLREALKDIDAIRIIYTCMPVDLTVNARALSSAVLEALGLAPLSFDTLPDLFSFLRKRSERIIIVLDEYQDMKRRADNEYVDALFRTIIDELGENLSLVLSGSSMRLMSALLEADNPLFQRFSLTIRLDELDYSEASSFYPAATIRDRIMLYGVFGGMPQLNAYINQDKSVKENIIDLFIDENGIARNYVRSVIDTEISSIPDAFTIISALGNGKKKYTEILSYLHDQASRIQLPRTLKRLITAGLIRKRMPINSDNRNTVFYELCSNCIRFYFAYLLRSDDYVTANSNGFFDRMITPSLTTFVSYRFEEIAKAYFHRMAKEGLRDDILRIGSYWYDDRKSRKNGEFDVALETYDGYEIYECKFLEAKAASSLVRSEKRNVEEIEGIHASKFGFISSSGFEEEIDGVTLISGEDIYGV